MPELGGLRAQRWRLVSWISVWLAVVPVALARAGVLAESDTFWEIRTGELILDSGRIPGTDPFSWTAFGRPWHPNSWAFDVLLAPVYRSGGFTAVALFGTGLVMAIVGVMLVQAHRLGAGPAATAIVILLAAPALVGWFAVRPQLADYLAVPLLLLLVRALSSAAGEGTTSSGRRLPTTLVAIALLHAVWVNLHAAATLGVGLVAAAGAASVVAAWRAGRPARVAVHFAGGVLAAAAGTLANPAGWGVLAQGWHVHAASTGLIVEWMPLNVADPVQDLTLLAGLGALIVAVARRYWSTVAFVAVLGVGSVAAVRFQPILAVCAIPVLAAACGAPAVRRRADRLPGLPWAVAAMLSAAWAVPAVLAAPHLGRPLLPVAPVRALPGGCRLVNPDQIGGLVILLRPDVPVSLDSRNDLYGRVEAVRLKRLIDDVSGAPQRLAEFGATCVLAPSTSGLARQLAVDPQWREILTDRGESLFARRNLADG